ncbi:MAG: hypothetical protein M1281_17705 [Chloroflexi bacterium]|nr:hypothetical protein [Chloroflexota bacterium]
MNSGLFHRISFWLTRFIPGPYAWRGAAYGLFALLAVFAAYVAYTLLDVPGPNGGTVVGLAVVLAVCLLAGGVAVLLAVVVRHLPSFFIWAFTSTALFFFGALVFQAGANIVTLTMLYFLLAAALTGAGAWTLIRVGFKNLILRRRVMALAGLAVGLGMLAWGVIWVLDPGTPSTLLADAAGGSASTIPVLNLPDPSLPGKYPVRSLSYGSGDDLHRPEYADQAAIITPRVDGSAFIAGWDGPSGWLRTRYWGFDATYLPLNGRVWYPAGEGPFPIVLAIHGNHPMEDYSDSGYAYLGELLASRGFIFVSVDENFLNIAPMADMLSPSFSGLINENDARAWVVLEHLRMWRAWQAAPQNPFYGKINLEQVGLIGHSRGGSAVAIAAAFNRLPYDPDNAKIRFDYNFGIRGVFAIAPTEGPYYPGGRGASLENINYFVIQGAQDADLPSFEGLDQYARVKFTDQNYWFKGGLYISGANHNQFNTVWGKMDRSRINGLLLNLEQLLPATQQQQIANIYVSAFFETALKGEQGYIPLLQDHRNGADWLPQTVYISRFVDSTYHYLSTYEEDVNLATTTASGGTISAANLSSWKEKLIPLRYISQQTSAVYLGWEETISKAAYTLSLPSDGFELTPHSTLTFALADAQGRQSDPIDLTIELVDRGGQITRLPLCSVACLQPQLHANPYKTGLTTSHLSAETILQSFALPLQAFRTSNPQFDPPDLAEIRFIFDRTPQGAVYLDDVGFRE